MHKLKRLWSSLSFRINAILLIVMCIMGYIICKTTISMNGVLRNSDDLSKMLTIVTSHIDSKMQLAEGTVHTATLLAYDGKLDAKKLDQIKRNAGDDVDSVYVLNSPSGIAQIDSCIAQCQRDTTLLWSEPYHRDGKWLVTFVSPVSASDSRVVCADFNLDCIGDEIDEYRVTEWTKVNIVSSKGIIIYDDDKAKIGSVEEDESKRVDENTNRMESRLDVNNDVPVTMFSQTMDYTKWQITSSVPVNDQSEMTMVINFGFVALLIIIFLIVATFLIIAIRKIVGPLRSITDATAEVAKGNFKTVLPKVKMNTDIRKLRDSFELMQHELEHYMDDLRSTTEQKAIMERDLRIAADIQQGMIPQTFPAFPDHLELDIYGVLIPARTVGGDVFDYFIHDNRLFFCLGDVSGKGVSAALFMSAAIHLFRNVGRHTSAPAEIVSAINDGLCDGNEQNMFCTLFVGVLNLTDGKLNYCNAGHNAPLLSRADGTQFLSVKPNMPTGAIDNYPYEEEQVTLSRSDVMLLYTDGVTEAENLDKKLYGDDATLKTIASSQKLSMHGMVDELLDSLRQFTAGAEQSDDITLLAIQWK